MVSAKFSNSTARAGGSGHWQVIALTAVVLVALASAGCMSSRDEFARTVATTKAAQPATQPMLLTGAGPQVGAGGAPAKADTGTQQPAMALAEPGAAVPPGPAPTAKLLTPEEKARLIAELEALAKSQNAR